MKAEIVKKISRVLLPVLIVMTISVFYAKDTLAQSAAGQSNRPTPTPTISKKPTSTPVPAVKSINNAIPTPLLKVTQVAKPTATKTPTPIISKPIPSVNKPISTKSPTPTTYVVVRSPGQVVAGSVASINGTTLTISKDKKAYLVKILPSSLFRKRYWGVSDLKSVAVGDRVNITGTFLDSKKTIMEATLFRNLSIMKRRGVVFGTVTKASQNTLYIQPKGYQVQKVSVGTATLVDKAEVGVNLAQIKVGDRVRVKGLWDRETNTITEVTQIKDFMLPSVQAIISPPKKIK